MYLEVKYIKVFVDNLDALESLTDSQRGKLFTAILRYGRDRTEPELKGAAKVLFPIFKAQIDREIVGMEETAKIRSRAGRIGGQVSSQAKRVQSESSKTKQMLTNASKTKQMLANASKSKQMLANASKTSIENREQNTEDREQRIENREPRTENRESNTEYRGGGTENREDTASAVRTPSLSEGTVYPPPHMITKGEYGWVQLTQEQYQMLLTEMGEEQLDWIIRFLDEKVQLNGNKYHWQDWVAVIRKAFRENWGERERSAEQKALRQNTVSSGRERETSYDLEEIERLISGKRGSS